MIMEQQWEHIAWHADSWQRAQTISRQHIHSRPALRIDLFEPSMPILCRAQGQDQWMYMVASLLIASNASPLSRITTGMQKQRSYSHDDHRGASTTLIKQ